MVLHTRAEIGTDLNQLVREWRLMARALNEAGDGMSDHKSGAAFTFCANILDKTIARFELPRTVDE
jgi:hypothetical protein